MFEINEEKEDNKFIIAVTTSFWESNTTPIDNALIEWRCKETEYVIEKIERWIALGR